MKHLSSDNSAVLPVSSLEWSGRRGARVRSLAALTGSLALAAGWMAALPMQAFSGEINASKTVPAIQMQAPAGDQKPAGGDTAVSGEAYDASKAADLRGHLGETIEIKGTPTGTGESKTGGVLFLNFSRQRGAGVTIVFFLLKGGATPAPDEGTRPNSAADLKNFVGKEVLIKGQLTDHQGDVQMVLRTLEEIRVQEPAKTP